LCGAAEDFSDGFQSFREALIERRCRGRDWRVLVRPL